MVGRKIFTVVAASAAVGILLGLSSVVAQDDNDSPLHKLMTKVQQNDTTILKGTRTAVNYKKQKDDVVKAAEELAKLGKESRKFTEPAKEKKKPQKDWEDKSDAFVKEVEAFAGTLANKDTDQVKAKAAYKAVKQKCADCHDIYKPDTE
jgi:cytochrome c556